MKGIAEIEAGSFKDLRNLREMYQGGNRGGATLGPGGANAPPGLRLAPPVVGQALSIA